MLRRLTIPVKNRRVGFLGRFGYNALGELLTFVKRKECSREDATGAKNEKEPDEVVLGALGVFARDLSFSYTKINNGPSVRFREGGGMGKIRRAILAALLLSVSAAGADIAYTDGRGRIETFSLEGDLVGIGSDLRIYLAGWGRSVDLADATDVKFVRDRDLQRWTGKIEVEPGKFYRFEQVLRQAGGAADLSLRVTAEADVKIEGVFFELEAPISAFAGGKCEMISEGAAPARAALPASQPEEPHLVSGSASRIVFENASGELRLEESLDRPRPAGVQDERKWNSPQYAANVNFAPDGQLPAGKTAALELKLKLTGKADHSPVRLSLDAKTTRYRFDGFGGDFCMDIASPVTQYTLNHLRVAWARTAMTLDQWAPTDDTALPEKERADLRKGRDRPGTPLRQEFLLARQIRERGIPYCISIWQLPEWMYTDPGKGPQAHQRIVAPDKWPAVLDAIGSYLVHAKEQYGAEPDLFSFNESDYGVMVRLSPAEHSKAIRRIGDHLKQLGLKTKMLLGDVCVPGNGLIEYVRPAAADPEAMRNVGAVSFHSWGGASPETYAAWADFAEKHNLPLLVAEAGVDSSVWYAPWEVQSFYYALRELRMYQELLMYARPRSMLRWEFTGDYAMVNYGKDPSSGAWEFRPAPGYRMVQHLCNLTPPNADALTTGSSDSRVLFTAFRGLVGGRTEYTLHVANLGAARPATVSGIPAGIERLRLFRTSETESFRSLESVEVKNGVVQTDLAPLSFLTLTTMTKYSISEVRMDF
jgi:hypothetical protein